MATPFDYPTDLIIGPYAGRAQRIVRGLSLLGRVAIGFDLIHFHFAVSLLPRFLDLPLLKAMGKKIVVEFWGSDVRKPSQALAKNPWSLPRQDDATIDARLRIWARYADAAIVADHELLEYVSSYFRKIFIVKQRAWLDDLTPAYPNPDCKRPVVVHAPSHRGVKGTEYVLKAFEDVGKRAAMQVVLVEARSHQETLQLIAKADIVVDQLRLGTYGLLAVEAMAMGKPVIAYIREDLRASYPPSLPIVSATPYTIGEALQRLVDDGVLRRRLGVMGRQYVEEHHDARKLAQELLDIYREL
jgi:hypothetical protein